jgi:SAM-dependent methyltransferase
LNGGLEAHLQHQLDHSQQFFWHRLRWHVVRRYLPKATPFELLDIGAGAGNLARFLERDRPQATYRFIEPISSLRQVLRQRHGDAADATEEDGSTDARFVVLLDVLEHQQDDRAFLQDLVGKMRADSTLLLTVPARQHFWSQWDERLGHYRRYEKGALFECFEGLPLRLHEVSFLFPELVPLALLRRRRGGKGKRGEGATDAEFPDLPRLMNDLLYGLGTMSLSFRRHWKTGTSLFMAATIERSGADPSPPGRAPSS